LSIVFGTAPLVIGGAGVLGFAAAAILILMLTLPPILSPPDDVHRTAAAMFTISYSCAVIVPVLSGIAWDLTGVPATAFIPIGLCAFLLIGPALARPIRPPPR
jgi:CP family cyanate transporter-like MFS transporter